MRGGNQRPRLSNQKLAELAFSHFDAQKLYKAVFSLTPCDPRRL